MILGDYDAIAQQTNCVGRFPVGLALAIEEILPYGSPYKERRPDRRKKQFAMMEDCSKLGTIQVRAFPYDTKDGTWPDVICMMAQWELGPALKYDRVPCPAE